MDPLRQLYGPPVKNLCIKRLLPHFFFRFSNEDLVNYLTFEKILTMASSTTEYMRSLNAELAAIFSGVKADPPRYK